MDKLSCPKTWLTESILVTICCCTPFGIAGIVHASRVSSLYREGRYDEAKEASGDACKWVLLSLLLGIPFQIFNILSALFLGEWPSTSFLSLPGIETL